MKGDTMSLGTVSKNVFCVSGTKRTGNGKSTNFNQVLKQNIGTTSDRSSANKENVSRKQMDRKKTDTFQAPNSSSDVRQTTNSKATDSSNMDITSKQGEEIVEDLNESLEQLKTEIKKKFSITDEELESMLAMLGMNLVDLFQPEQFTQFFLQASGAQDISVLLTDEELANNLNEMLETISSINVLSKLNLTTETAQQLLEGMNIDAPNSGNEFVAVEEDASLKQIQEGQKESGEDSKTSITDKITIEVERDTDNQGSSNQGSSNQDSLNQGDGQETIMAQQSTMYQTVGSTTTVIQETNFVDHLTSNTVSREIVTQVVNHIKVMLSPEQTSMELMLNPEHLGKIQMTVSEKSGVMTAQLVTETVAAKEAIESQMQTLKETLEAQGFKVSAVEVSVANFSFASSDQSNFQQKNQEQEKKSDRKVTKLGMVDVSNEDLEEENTTKNVVLGSGSQIDIIA